MRIGLSNVSVRNRLSVLLLAASLCWLASAHAETRLKITETWPQESNMTLGSGQYFFLRILYDTDTPIKIWARPFWQGQPVGGDSNPSRNYNGQGEAIGWFSVAKPGVQIDEVRIETGRDGTDKAAGTVSWRGHLVVGNFSQPESRPAWVTQMLEADEAFQKKAVEQSLNEPTTFDDVAFFGLFALSVIAVGLAGTFWPVWSLWRWNGAWRIAAALLTGWMAFIVLRIIVDGLRDPTSHNMWPFEILYSGFLSSVAVAVLTFLRRLFHGKST